jgi:hypothetical protein
MTFNPVKIDLMWSDLTEDQKFRLWTFASSAAFYRGNDDYESLCEALTVLMERWGY